MTPNQLLEDFVKNRRYGKLEFFYKDGKLVFVKKEETFLPAGEEYHEKMQTVQSR